MQDLADPVGRLPFNELAMVAALESDLIRMRTREGLAVANAKSPALRPETETHSARQESHLVDLHRSSSLQVHGTRGFLLKVEEIEASLTAR